MKEKEAASLITGRAIIFSLLKNTLKMKLIKEAKNVKEMSFENLDFLIEKIFEDVDKKEVERIVLEVYDLDSNKIINPEKLSNYFDWVTPKLIKKKLKKYNRTNYFIEKIKEGHELVM